MLNKNKNKPKIVIIVDVEGWAFYNAATEIKKNLNNQYDIDIISIDMFENNMVKLLLYCSTYDLVFFIWRGLISWLYSEASKIYIEKLGFEYEEFINKYLKNRNVVTAVYDHLFIESEKERTDFIFNNVKDYIVCSEKLNQIYNEYPNIKKPSMIISDGVDLELFKMNDKKKYFNIENRTIKIGWTGNSKFKDEKDDDLKGLNKIIKPAIEELIQEGYNIKLDIADRNIKMIPHDKMNEYYNNIDIYVCASRTEGHPDTVLEAMACGVPVISTDVGIVPEVFGKKQKEFIINRTKNDLKNKIIKLLENKQMMKELSEENLEQIQEWSWQKKSEKFKIFFDKNIH